MPDKSVAKDYGCDDCRMLKGKHCKLWEVKVPDPHNSHCESIHFVRDTTPLKTTKRSQ